MSIIEQVFSKTFDGSVSTKTNAESSRGNFGGFLRVELLSHLNLGELSDLAPPRTNFKSNTKHYEDPSPRSQEYLNKNDDFNKNIKPGADYDYSEASYTEKPRSDIVETKDEGETASHSFKNNTIDERKDVETLHHEAIPSADHSGNKLQAESDERDSNGTVSSQKIDPNATKSSVGSENSNNTQANLSYANVKKDDDLTTPGQTIDETTATLNLGIANAVSPPKTSGTTNLSTSRAVNQPNDAQSIIKPDAIGSNNASAVNSTVATNASEATIPKGNPSATTFDEAISKSNLLPVTQDTNQEVAASSSVKLSPTLASVPGDIVGINGNPSATKPAVPLTGLSIDGGLGYAKMPSINPAQTEQAVHLPPTDNAPQLNQNRLQAENIANGSQLSTTTETITPPEMEKTGVKTTALNTLGLKEPATKPETGLKLGQLSEGISINTKENQPTMPRTNNAAGSNLLLAQQNAKDMDPTVPQTIVSQRGTLSSIGQLSASNLSPENVTPLDVAGNKNQGSNPQGHNQFSNHNGNPNGDKPSLLNNVNQKNGNDSVSATSRIPQTGNANPPATVALGSDAASLSKADGQPTQFNLSQSGGGSGITGASVSNPSINKPIMQAATNQVFIQLTKAVQNGENKITIQLRPEELGRVEVKLDISGDGRVKAMVMADKPETLDLLQRDSRVLERALQESGLKTDNNSLSFNLQGKGNNQQFNQASTNHSHANDELSPEADALGDSSDNHLVSGTAIGVTPDGAVDVLA